MSRLSARKRTLATAVCASLWGMLLAPSLADTGPAAESRASGGAPEWTTPPQPAAEDGVPRWLEDVRAQRRALQEQRRAHQAARRRAIDPVGEAERQAREQEFYRRRQDMRQMIEQDRRLFFNFGPWPSRWAVPPATTKMPSDADYSRDSDQAQGAGSGAPAGQSETQSTPVLPDWNNSWYFHGW
jgi:hypothetical protein